MALSLAVAAAVPVCPGMVLASGPVNVAIVVSMAIRPYMDAAEGIQEVLEKQPDTTLELIQLEAYKGGGIGDLTQRLGGERISSMIAVGPEATRYVWREVVERPDAIRLYTMVLNPESIVPQPDRDCGIALNIPVETQIREIRKHLPRIRRIGLLFDPKNNQAFFQSSIRPARLAGMEVLPVEVTATRQIYAALDNFWQRIDGLWLIPDRTVISESLIRYIIKSALSNGVPVIGYNRFFVESGAAMAMVLNYRDIGRQTAQLHLERLADQPCRTVIPAFDTVVDERVLKKIGIEPAAPETGDTKSGKNQ